MKITDVKVWLVQGIKYNWTLLKIYTDAGYTGVGEATNWPGSPVVYEAVKHVGQRIIGLDPMRTDFIWTKLYRDLNWIGPYGASMSAMNCWEEHIVKIFFCMQIIGLQKVNIMRRTMLPRHGS